MALRIKGAEKPKENDDELEEVTPDSPEVGVEEEPLEEEVVEEDVEESPLMAGGIVDPIVARYTGPMDMCATCIHYLEPNACAVVAGPIEPEGICSIYTPDTEDVEDVEPVDDVPVEELV